MFDVVNLHAASKFVAKYQSKRVNFFGSNLGGQVLETNAPSPEIEKT